MKLRKKQENNDSNEGKKLVSYYFNTKNTKFIHLLRITSKWTELYKSEEAKLSICISFISSAIWLYIFNTVEIEVFNEIIRNITSSIFSTLIGMLGFIIGGLAILTGTITNKVVNKINKKHMVDNLIGILFSFYFIGLFIGIAIFSFILMYLLSYPEIEASNVSVSIISFVLSYLLSFSIIYSIAQLGTCLRIFLVSYKFMESNEEENLEESKN